MPNERVLIIDDETSIQTFLTVILSSQGYTVIKADSGHSGISSTATENPDIIILDLGLPDIDGVEVTRLLRQWTHIPIIILTVRGSENDKVSALDAGADDYLTKPFGVGELLARIRASLRRSINTMSDPVFKSGSLIVDMARRVVNVSGHDVQLTPTEYNLLKVLIIDAGKVLTHHHLLRAVWGTAYADEFHMLRVNISNLRRKIEPEPERPQFIITEPGVGYRLRFK